MSRYCAFKAASHVPTPIAILKPRPIPAMTHQNTTITHHETINGDKYARVTRAAIQPRVLPTTDRLVLAQFSGHIIGARAARR